MGRRNDHTREEIKKMAIEAGKKIIEEEGFQNLGARKIARAIGYTVGSLYNVFDNYLDIVLHINEKTLDDIKYSLENCITRGQEGIEIITSLAFAYVDYARNNKNLWNALFEFQHPEESEMPEWYVEKVESMFKIPVKVLLPVFNNDVERTGIEARILWGGVHGICQLSLTHRLSHDNDELMKYKVKSLIENYLRGVEVSDVRIKQLTAT